jgi:MFS family permease
MGGIERGRLHVLDQPAQALAALLVRRRVDGLATIAYAILLITGARLGDLLGHRTAFQAGLALFTAASLACGLAEGTGLLIGFRFVQGAGATLMVPQVTRSTGRCGAG